MCIRDRIKAPQKREIVAFKHQLEQAGLEVTMRVSPVSYTHLDVYKRQEQDEDAEPETVLPPLAEGQTFDNPAAEISERYTQPPKAFTEDTLLSAMENAGKEETPEDAERKGLGLSLIHI